MAKKISSSDLFEQEDIFKGVRDSATKTLAVFNELQAELKATAQGLKGELTANTQASTAQLKQFSAASEQANKLMQQAVQIEKLKAQADQQKIKAEQEIVKLQKMQAQETARLAKEQEKAAKLAANEASAYSKLSAELNKARKAYKDLAVTNQENTTEGKELLATITELDTKLKKVDATVGQHQRNVGNYEGATRNLKKELKDLTRELMNMETSDPRFQQMTQRAGELKDQIQDTQSVVKATAGSAMENFAGSVAKVGQIGVAAFQGMQSGMMLLGIENEAVLQSMARLQALAGLGDALRTLGGLGDMLTQIRAGFTAAILKMGLFTAAKEADTAATIANTTATRAQGAATATASSGFGKMGAAAKGALTGIRTGLAATGIGLLVVALGTIVAYWDDIKEAVFGVSAEQKKLNEISLKNQHVAEKTLEDYENQNYILKLQGKTDKELLNGKIALQERVVKANIDNLNNLQTTYKAEIAASRAREKGLFFLYDIYKSLITIALDFAAKPIDLFIEKINSIAETVGLDKLITFNTEDIKKNAIGAINAVQGTVTSIYKSLGVLSDETKINEDIENAKTKLLISQNELAQSKLELRNENTKNELKSSKDSIDNVKNEAKEKLDLQREIRDKEIDLMADGIEKEQALIQEKYKREKEDLIANSKDKIVDAEQLADAEYLIDENLKKELADLTKKYDEEARKKRLEEAEFIKKNKEDIAEQERQNNIKIAQDEMAFEDKQTKAKLASLEGKEKEEYEKRLAFQKELDDLNQLKLDGAFASQEDYEKAVDNLKEKYADKDTKRQEEIQKFAEKTAAYFKKKSEEKVKEIDKEISAAEKQSEALKTMAENGNINAQQSLAEQQRIINEANLKKQRELRKQMRMEQGLALFKLLGENADKKNALGETIKDATGLMAFINSLPMFYDGTEDTGSGGGVDGKGGFHAILHPHERVIPKSLNDQIGNLTNEQLTRLAMEYQNGRLIGQDVAHSSMELAILATKLDNLTEVIKHKPETNIALGQITQSAMEIVESRRTGNTVIYNRFKVRK